MSYPQARHIRAKPVSAPASITFCSCAPCRTELEHIPTKREIRIMWLKDAAAGAGLVVFMISSFLLAGGAQMVLRAL